MEGSGAMKSIDKLLEWAERNASTWGMDEIDEIVDEIESEVEDMVPLPVDADGVPIHVGDVMEWDNGTFTVHELKVTEDGWTTWDEQHGYTVHADECRHHHAPTVEDVLREFAYGLGVPVADSYVAATAAKLRLAEGVDE